MPKLKFKHVKPDVEYDYVIIGAGIAGLYSAWRILDHFGRDTKIAICERLNRTGGRLDSDQVDIRDDEFMPVPRGVSKVKEEQGGMRFNYEMHELMQTFEKLGLCDQIVPFPMSSSVSPKSGMPAINTNRYFIRGRSFTVAEANAGNNMIWSELYDLNEAEVGLSPSQIVTNVYRRLLLENRIKFGQEQTPEFWTKFRETCTWRGVKLIDWQMGGLLKDMGYSAECLELLADTIGFAGLFKGPGNAGDGMQVLADFPVDPVYYTLRDGFSTLPNSIVAEIKDSADIFLSTNVNSLQSIEGGFNVVLSEAQKYQNATPTNGETKTIRGKKVISAIASKGMKELFVRSTALHLHEGARQLWEDINASIGMELMKINFYYYEAWWLNGATGRPDIQFGPNFSSMPINSIYPFYAVDNVEVTDDGKSLKILDKDKPAALTMYCDFTNAVFWGGLQNVGPKYETALQIEEDELEPQRIYGASEAVVAELSKQLGILFGMTNVPSPALTSFRAWNGEDDFEFAYHQWGLSVEDSKVRARLAKPYADKDFFICNEAFSDMQGWVMGSLRSSNDALKHLGIKPLDNPQCKSSEPEEVSDESNRRYSGFWGG